MTYTPSAHATLAAVEPRVRLTMEQRRDWAYAFMDAAHEFLAYLDGPHLDMAVRLRDAGMAPDRAAGRVRFSLL